MLTKFIIIRKNRYSDITIQCSVHSFRFRLIGKKKAKESIIKNNRKDLCLTLSYHPLRIFKAIYK